MESSFSHTDHHPHTVPTRDEQWEDANEKMLRLQILQRMETRNEPRDRRSEHERYERRNNLVPPHHEDQLYHHLMVPPILTPELLLHYQHQLRQLQQMQEMGLLESRSQDFYASPGRKVAPDRNYDRGQDRKNHDTRYDEDRRRSHDQGSRDRSYTTLNTHSDRYIPADSNHHDRNNSNGRDYPERHHSTREFDRYVPSTNSTRPEESTRERHYDSYRTEHRRHSHDPRNDRNDDRYQRNSNKFSNSYRPYFPKNRNNPANLPGGMNFNHYETPMK